MEISIHNKKYILSFNFILNLPLLIFFSPYKKHTEIKINNKLYKMYIADNIFSQIIGYRFRSPADVKKNEIMLFKFKKTDEYSFWMKDVHFPIKLCSYTNMDFNEINEFIKMAPHSSQKHKIKGHYLVEFPVF